MDRTQIIFDNKMPKKVVKKANKSKQKFLKKFGDDTNEVYHLKVSKNMSLENILDIKNISIGSKKAEFEDNAIVIGNIRMGFGHYRISLAIASCALSMGYIPYWFDLNSLNPSTGSKMVEYQNNLYSMGSRLSQKSSLFNKLYWEPLNSEGFKQISYNAVDQKNAEILAPLYRDFPKDIPFVATHVWPSQGAIHGGLRNVVNIIPDNWPMALHLSEGAVHTVQTPFAYLGYKELHNMASSPLKPMPEGSIYNVGHYIDDELVRNIEVDCEKRIERLNNGKPLRILMTIGGAGAQYNLFKELINFLMEYVKKGQVKLFINFGDHLKVYNHLVTEIKGLQNSVKLLNDWDKFLALVNDLDNQNEADITLIYHKDIFRAVYSTNLLMRQTDILATKPSELAFYPVPKLMLPRVGGHEAYGAIHASEVGDGTYECLTIKESKQTLANLLNDHELLISMNRNIIKNKEAGLYNGGYEVIKLATKK